MWRRWNIFLSRAERLGLPIRRPHALSSNASQPSNVSARLPRGAAGVRETINQKESARWATTDEILRHARRPGQVVLGKHDGFIIGAGDDKPMLTVASARSGKTAQVLKASLCTYRGPMLVLDPKGELASGTAEHRRTVLGQTVHVLDPFGCCGLPSAHFNALDEIDADAASCVDDVDAITQTLIIPENGSEGSHWTNSAAGLLRGCSLLALTLPPEERNLVTVRELLMLTHDMLAELRAEFEAKGASDPDAAVQQALFLQMRAAGKAFGGALAGAGSSFLRKADRERASIVSTAETQTLFLDSAPLRAISRRSDFRLGELAERPTTIYVCLPAERMESHFRWLRLVIRLALMALARKGTYPRDKLPIIFLLEEMAVLQHMPVLEQAAAYFPGFGVKLWGVVQDLSQLRRYYKASFDTFVGNCGVLQFFGNADKETLDYISDRLGSLSFVRGRFGSVGIDGKGSADYIDKERLAYPHEIAAAFARATNAQLLLMQGVPPMAIERLSFAEVERMKVTAAYEA